MPQQVIDIGEEADKSHWPKDVKAITIGGMDRLGVNKDGNLYWDGKEVVTRSIVRLGPIELWIAGIATAATLGSFVLSLGDTFGWWPSTAIDHNSVQPVQIEDTTSPSK